MFDDLRILSHGFLGEISMEEDLEDAESNFAAKRSLQAYFQSLKGIHLIALVCKTPSSEVLDEEGNAGLDSTRFHCCSRKTPGES
jgi:hypothetical protein